MPEPFLLMMLHAYQGCRVLLLEAGRYRSVQISSKLFLFQLFQVLTSQFAKSIIQILEMLVQLRFCAHHDSDVSRIQDQLLFLSCQLLRNHNFLPSHDSPHCTASVIAIYPVNLTKLFMKLIVKRIVT